MMRIVILISIIVFPLYLIIQYQSIKLQKTTDQTIKTSLSQIQQQLTQKYTQKHNKILQNYAIDNSNPERRPEYIQNLIKNILKNKNPQLETIYYKKLIINLLISRQFLQQKQIILIRITNIIAWFNQQYKLNWKYKIWNQSDDQFNKIEENIIIIFRQFKYQYIQQNIANKIKSGQYRNAHYLEQIGMQLRSLPMLAHCKYTSLECQQITFIIVHQHNKHANKEKYQTFWSFDKQIYFLDSIQPKMMFNALISAFQLDLFVQFHDNKEEHRQLLQEIVKMKQMKDQLKIINYLIFISKQYQFNYDILFKKWQQQPSLAIKYLKNAQFRSPYYHTHQQVQSIRQILSIIQSNDKNNIINNTKHQKKILLNPLTSDKIGLIDIFPNDFKLGVYLPLFVIFMFPIFTKLQQCLQFFFRIIFQNKKDKYIEKIINKQE